MQTKLSALHKEESVPMFFFVYASVFVLFFCGSNCPPLIKVFYDQISKFEHLP